MAKPVVLVTGKNGQLGNELQVVSQQFSQLQFVFTDVAEMDITDDKKVAEVFSTYKPAVCINTAAYTAVDKAETEKDTALLINGTAAGILAQFCKKYQSRFIQISTDYVFSGSGLVPYKEDDPVDPVNYYGTSKLIGEQLAMTNYADTIIIRTSWVYSFFGNNFVKTMLRLMKERSSINVINDQFGSPTYAADLAEAIMQVALHPQPKAGIYHYSNEGIINWYQFATAIKEQAHLACSIQPIDTSGYPTPAKRPAYSVMSKEKMTKVFGIETKPWLPGLQACLQLLHK